MKYTVNQLLSMQKALKTRQTQLDELKQSSASRQVYRTLGTTNTEQVTEPTYDIKKLDKMLTGINKALWDIDQLIKESNARTKIDVALDFDALMKEIE